MTHFTIAGAGLAGLLAGVMLRDECDGIFEEQSVLPNNHAALLRFKSNVVGDVINVPFTPVQVIKAVVPFAGNPVGDALAYSLKTNGTATIRSSITAEGRPETRYIAPPDLIDRLARKLQAHIYFDYPALFDGPLPTISTIPMPALMAALDYDGPRPEFRHRHGWVITQHLEGVDACATLYFPGPTHYPYRASITRDQLIIEGTDMNEMSASWRQHVIWSVLPHFGLPRSAASALPIFKQQKYAKILPIGEHDRRRFILWATEKHRVFSLGRFATWRPGLLMDDLVSDIRTIQRIARTNTYEARKG